MKLTFFPPVAEVIPLDTSSVIINSESPIPGPEEDDILSTLETEGE